MSEVLQNNDFILTDAKSRFIGSRRGFSRPYFDGLDFRLVPQRENTRKNDQKIPLVS